MRHRLWSRAAGALVAVLGAVTLPVAVGAPAHAAEACSARSLSRPFATAFNDFNDYFLATSGTFESGTSGWTLGAGVTRVVDNEPWRVAGSGSTSLRIPGGVSVSTPVMCIAPNEDSMRFFVKAPGSGVLKVTARATDTTTGQVTTSACQLDYTSRTGWFVTPRIVLPSTQLRPYNQYVQFTFTVQGSAALQIDDLFVDPSRTI